MIVSAQFGYFFLPQSYRKKWIYVNLYSLTFCICIFIIWYTEKNIDILKNFRLRILISYKTCMIVNLEEFMKNIPL